jgi:hypothetical protein
MYFPCNSDGIADLLITSIGMKQQVNLTFGM